jgi:Ni/Fe-hydrogenase subunit HybB-like protein
MGNESGRSRVALVVWGVILLLVLALAIGLVSGGWVLSTKTGCADRGNTDPDYGNANWYGLGIGVCVAE